MPTVHDDDLMAPELNADPYPFFRRMRESAPVHFNKRWGGTLIFRHADVVAALSDPRLSSDAFTPFRETINIPDVIANTISGMQGVGGVETMGRHRIGVPNLKAMGSMPQSSSSNENFG